MGSVTSGSFVGESVVVVVDVGHVVFAAFVVVVVAISAIFSSDAVVVVDVAVSVVTERVSAGQNQEHMSCMNMWVKNKKI